ncbi:MAG TPA: hypothetical protein VM266_07350 [Solirubrobacteraceae bacterium]|nr:hypothetical protein [Solirubrobacteraceae bacterium]
MRRAATALLLLLIALVATATPPAGAAKKKRCAKAGITRLENERVRIYGTSANRIYACNLRTGRRVFITRSAAGADDLDEFRGFVRARLAGRYVAFGDDFGCDRAAGDCHGSVRVVDALTGKDRHAFNLFARREGERLPMPVLSALALKKNGSAAAIVAPSGEAPWEVWRLDADGVARIDSGNVDPGSLATNETRIYWLRDGAAFSAPWR